MRLWKYLILALLVVAPSTRMASANEILLSERLAALEADVDALRSQNGGCNDCQPCPCPCPCDCPEPVCVAGAELTVLRLHAGSLVFDDFLVEEFRITPEYDLDTAFRVWLGREGPNGLGRRVTYWDFKDASDLAWNESEDEYALFSSALDFYTLDLELTRRATFANWELGGSLGIRVGGVEKDCSLAVQDTVVVGGFRTNHDFDGVGPTLSFGMRQPFGGSGFSAYGNFRGSLLYGVTDFEIGARGEYEAEAYEDGLRGSITDQTVAIWEMQVGLQYQRPTDYGTWFARAGIESQLWEMPPVFLGLGDENIGLFGPTFGLGFMW